jgi:hypothetical protein
MARPKPTFQTVQILLRLHPDTVAGVDAARGDMSRQTWIAGLINSTLARAMPPLSPERVGEIMRKICAPMPSPSGRLSK